MPFIPHTEADVRAMLEAIGVASVEALFDEIPAALRRAAPADLPEGMSEMAVSRLMQERAAADGHYLGFIGAGAYEHHIPAAVWQIVTRGEFYSSYTPYQAEASQGTLQLLYEYQTMMTRLTGLAATNASLYDGASALAEAALMAVRLHGGAHGLLVPRTVDPIWRRVVHTIGHHQGLVVSDVPYDAASGATDLVALSALDASAHAALVVPQPNFFGVLEPVDEMAEWAHARGLLVIALVNPTALAVLKPPGEWGVRGADIAVGDGQPLGVPLASGGPYFGFLACRAEHVRQMPGRVVGRTVDAAGKPGYTLTLQTREQHIRRAKATSNICTNQGLMVAAATLYLALLGPAGLVDVARASHANTLSLVEALTAIAGVRRRFAAPFFHECVVELDRPVGAVLHALQAGGILGGLDLAQRYPELDRHLLVCATETKTAEDLRRYAAAMRDIVAAVKA